MMMLGSFGGAGLFSTGVAWYEYNGITPWYGSSGKCGSASSRGAAVVGQGL